MRNMLAKHDTGEPMYYWEDTEELVDFPKLTPEQLEERKKLMKEAMNFLVKEIRKNAERLWG